MLHLFLGHFVADHGFTNNSKIRNLQNLKLFQHMIWSIFAILAFTFDTLLKSSFTITVLVIFIVIHLVMDYVRVKVKNKFYLHIIELTGIFTALIFNFLVSKYFEFSYLSKEFVYYLLGMAVVSTAVSYFFRNFYPGDEDFEDLEGISERLAFFVFFLAGKPGLAFLSLGIGFLYRIWKIKKFSHVWWISPLSSIIITVLWKPLIF
ncbi:hypothetical protein JYK00_00100 [Thermosipho ferrireducens]|uniref:DUF3307 domain-containing protein n=1 Tax=Thermosipho ferrireducens TaxID=2571116 RepID=A0ABX7S5Z3_9BACT|nr:hypothetical protein [Thermosipho ferrireducens]QTA37993.1 hypothetical protein JYK00_00100 [Thermosipho ferrireducens]